MTIKSWLKHLINHLLGRPYFDNHIKYEQDTNTCFKIIRANKRHVKAIHELEKECFSDPWSIQSLKYEVTHPQSICLVAVNNKRVLGYISMRHILDEGHINNIAVNVQARRQGIGQQLIETLISEAKIQGITSFTLEVRSKNHDAISLYEKLGFETCGQRKDYYHTPTDDALVMWRSEEDL